MSIWTSLCLGCSINHSLVPERILYKDGIKAFDIDYGGIDIANVNKATAKAKYQFWSEFVERGDDSS